jgi:hypothetical protein
MREVDGVRQPPGAGHRRWFVDPAMELAVWQDASGRVVAFQLAYDRDCDEHVVSWRAGGGLRHDAVDDGEWPTGRCKRAPMLLPDGPIPRRRLRSAFQARAGALDPGIRRAVLRALARD